MKWFRHQSDANMDAKLQEVMLDYGLEGYGLYWYCLELIAGNVAPEKLTFELEHDCRIIARNTGSTPQRVQEMMTQFIKLGLFEESQGRITCLKLAKASDDYTAKLVRSKGTQAIDFKGNLETPTKSEKVPLEHNKTEEEQSNNIKSNTPAKPKLTKADKLFQKVRQNPEKFVCLNCIDDDLLSEWAKLRVKKNASDSDRALNAIESTLETLRTTMGIAPDQAIARQCDRGWTTVELEYFQNQKPQSQQVAVIDESLSDISMRTL
jgi:hypothetical protein